MLCYVAHPEFIGRLWLEVSLDEVRIERTFRIFSGASSTLATVHAFYPCLSHEPGYPLPRAVDIKLKGKLCMDPRRPIGAAASFVDLLDVSEEDPILQCMIRYRSLQPIVVSAGGDPQNATHDGNRVIHLLFLYEREYDCRVPSVSWAKKAAAFFNISRSIRRMRFSARSFLNSSRSEVVRPSR